MLQTTPDYRRTAAEERDNELFSAKESAKSWRNWTYGLGVLLGIAVIGNTWQSLSKPLPIIRYVEVDRASNQARVVDPAAERYEPSKDIVKAVLESDIKALRSVSIDKQLMNDNLNTLRICATPTGRQLIRTYLSKEDPRLQKKPRAVQMITRLERTPRTYEFRWQEWTYNESGQQDGPTVPPFYSASLTFERRDPRTEQELHECPTGIFLDTWTLGKDQ